MFGGSPGAVACPNLGASGAIKSPMSGPPGESSSLWPGSGAAEIGCFVSDSSKLVRLSASPPGPAAGADSDSKLSPVESITSISLTTLELAISEPSTAPVESKVSGLTRF